MKVLLEWFFGAKAHRQPDQPVPVEQRVAADFAVAPERLRITWLGHSCFLLEVDGIRILIDPVLGEFASPGALFGVPRFFPPPLAFDALPPIDAVIISHDHYDHLDHTTIAAFAARQVVPRFVTSLGVGSHLEAWGIPPDRIVELDWWEGTDVGGVQVTATPARHFSGRLPFARNRTFWSSWVIAGSSARVFAGADSGYFPGFAEIGRRLGPFDVTLLEIGAYGEGWPDIHLGPEQAVAAHLDLGGRLFIPAHWATFRLAFHAWTEPAERLIVAADAAGIDYVIPRPGESVDPSAPRRPERWWPTVPWKTAAESPIAAGGMS